MSFATVINCMDGRTQLPAIEYIMNTYKVDFVDSITEAGPNGILAQGTDSITIDSIMKRIDISVHKHGSHMIFLVGHYDCAGNPGPKEKQVADVQNGITRIKESYPEVDVRGLWIGESWETSEIK